MRPGDFSPGNLPDLMAHQLAAMDSFNEAGGFLPRKPKAGERCGDRACWASMRPGDFSPGNRTWRR